jgi:glutaminyl-tRNA synthetase
MTQPDVPAIDPTVPDGTAPADFVRQIIADDLKTNKNGGMVVTRFPPEPNGYLHIGHAKSICLNFGIAEENPGGICHLRFDDTNPSRENAEFVEAIKADVAWLGFDWGGQVFYASDRFGQLYEFAMQLVRDGYAYVCDLNPQEIREYRGTLTEPGIDSPFRDRGVAENLDLLQRMKAGEFEDGERVLRAKIDMGSPNINLRDPVLYRILKAEHHRTGNDWCIYPTYDFAHGQTDSLEGVTHSICTLEFEAHRALYNWLLDRLNVYHPQQIEFARLNLTHTILSKRRLQELVESGAVSGWDDPRMPTISGLRRLGYTPKSIRRFCENIGVARRDTVVEVAQLEHRIREDLNLRAPRVMGVLRPLKVVIDNYPEGQEEELVAQNNPEDPEMGSRTMPFSRELFIEEDDFMEDPPSKFYRLSPGREIRLKDAYYITCVDVVKDPATGKVTEVHCTYDPETKGGTSEDRRRVRGTSHWVSAAHCLTAEVRLYDHLFLSPNPGAGDDTVGDGAEPGDIQDLFNPDSLEVLTDCRVEPSLADAAPGSSYQFLRQGYFCVDSKDSKPGALVFNRTVSLRDSWARSQRGGAS